jgi:hypothetical protein
VKPSLYQAGNVKDDYPWGAGPRSIRLSGLVSFHRAGERTGDVQRLNDALIAVTAGRTHSLPQEEPDLQPDNSDYQLDNLALQLGKSNSQPGNFKS